MREMNGKREKQRGRYRIRVKETHEIQKMIEIEK